MGGEKLPRCGSVYPWQGSPPHGRGKVYVDDNYNANNGITPAWAGKRPPLKVSVIGHKDHPRMGGEKGFLNLALLLFLGSPPHGRGKVLYYAWM